jgi:serine/threonine-protein kinase RsbW
MALDTAAGRELLQVPATIDAVPRVVDYVARLVTEAGLTASQGRRLRLAAEEIVVNVATHASTPDDPAWVTLTGGIAEAGVWLRITDTAPPFDPTAPPAGGPVQSWGGVGLILVWNMVDRISYRRVDNRNETTLLLKTAPR